MQHKLSGDAQLAIIHIPGAVSSYLGSYVRSGKAYAPPELHEVSHLLEHLAFEGTKAYPDPLEFKSQVERNGAYFNAFTAVYLNWYEMVGENAEVERLLPLAISQLYEPMYTSERIVQQQQTVVNELKRYRENDGRRMRHYSSQRMVPLWNPEFDDRIAMTNAVTRDDLLKFHATHYGTANTFFVVAGDFDATRAEALIAQFNNELAGRPKGALLEVPRPPYASDFGGSVAVHQPVRKQQSSFLLRARHLEADLEMVAALKLIATMYTSGLSSRLNMKAREAGLTYSISSAAGLNVYDTEFAVSSETDIGKLHALVELSLEELQDLAKGGYSNAELERAKSFAAGQLRRSLETPASLAHWYGDDLALGVTVITPEEWIVMFESLDRSTLKVASERILQRSAMTLTLIGEGLEQQQGEYERLLHRYFPR